MLKIVAATLVLSLLSALATESTDRATCDEETCSAPDQLAAHRIAVLTHFYSRYNPQKVARVTEFVNNPKMDWIKIAARLKGMYGQTPDEYWRFQIPKLLSASLPPAVEELPPLGTPIVEFIKGQAGVLDLVKQALGRVEPYLEPPHATLSSSNIHPKGTAANYDWPATEGFNTTAAVWWRTMAASILQLPNGSHLVVERLMLFDPVRFLAEIKPCAYDKLITLLALLQRYINICSLPCT